MGLACSKISHPVRNPRYNNNNNIHPMHVQLERMSSEHSLNSELIWDWKRGCRSVSVLSLQNMVEEIEESTWIMPLSLYVIVLILVTVLCRHVNCEPEDPVDRILRERGIKQPHEIRGKERDSRYSHMSNENVSLLPFPVRSKSLNICWLLHSPFVKSWSHIFDCLSVINEKRVHSKL